MPVFQLRPTSLTGALASVSSPPLDGLSDWKAWPNTTSNSDPRLRPGTRQTPAYSSSPIGAVRADWDQPTGDAHSVRTRKRTEKVRQDTQVNHNTKDRALYICRTVLTGYVRKVPCNLPDISEPKQCCGRRHFSYSVVGAGIYHTRRTW